MKISRCSPTHLHALLHVASDLEASRFVWANETLKRLASCCLNLLAGAHDANCP